MCPRLLFYGVELREKEKKRQDNAKKNVQKIWDASFSSYFNPAPGFT